MMEKKAEILVHAQNLSINHKGRVLHSLNFDICEKEFVVILGISGAGKSTLLSVLCGYEQNISGVLEICGFNYYQNDRDIKKIIGFVPHEDLLFQNLSIKQNLMYACRLYCSNNDYTEKHVMDVIETVGLTSIADSKVSTISAGELKRTNIAVELLNHPQILVLDEPDSNLDIVNQNKIFDMLNGLRNAGTTIVVATHSVDRFSQEDDYSYMVMDRGRLYSKGTFKELLDSSPDSRTDRCQSVNVADQPSNKYNSISCNKMDHNIENIDVFSVNKRYDDLPGLTVKSSRRFKGKAKLTNMPKRQLVTYSRT